MSNPQNRPGYKPPPPPAPPDPNAPPKLLRMTGTDGKVTGYLFWCPGCKEPHPYGVPRWSFNGDEAAPTFNPSLLVFDGSPQHKTQCHLFLRDGRLEFLPDSQHELAGQTVDLPVFPNFNPPVTKPGPSEADAAPAKEPEQLPLPVAVPQPDANSAETLIRAGEGNGPYDPATAPDEAALAAILPSFASGSGGA
jgi:hypothetical protein